MNPLFLKVLPQNPDCKLLERERCLQNQSEQEQQPEALGSWSLGS